MLRTKFHAPSARARTLVRQNTHQNEFGNTGMTSGGKAENEARSPSIVRHLTTKLTSRERQSSKASRNGEKDCCLNHGTQLEPFSGNSPQGVYTVCTP